MQNKIKQLISARRMNSFCWYLLSERPSLVFKIAGFWLALIVSRRAAVWWFIGYAVIAALATVSYGLDIWKLRRRFNNLRAQSKITTLQKTKVSTL